MIFWYIFFFFQIFAFEYQKFSDKITFAVPQTGILILLPLVHFNFHCNSFLFNIILFAFNCSLLLCFYSSPHNQTINLALYIFTGQKLELAVNYNPGKQTPITLTTTRTVILIVVVSLFLLIPTVVAFIRVLDRPDTYGPSRPQAPAPPSASSSAPITPDCTSVAGSQSPITPPPFIDYVRKTLDETPYYKRGSRRFNSQYTY